MRAVASLAVVVTAVGCASGAATPSEPEAVETPTSTTRTPRVVDDSGRPQITFDPCLDIPDELLLQARYDTRSKEPTDYPMGTYSFIGCRFKGTLHIPGVLRRYGLNVLAGNVTLEEELAKDRLIATETTINGRRALLEVDNNNQNSCSIAVETEFGIVIFSRTYYPDHTRGVPREQWCSGLDDLASSIEPLLDLPHS